MHIRNLALDRLRDAPRLELVHDLPHPEGAWRELLDTFRALGQAAAICDVAGQLCGITPALAALLADEDDSAAVNAGIEAAASTARHADAPVDRIVAGHRAEYALRACRHGHLAGSPSAIVVVVHPVRALMPAHSALIARFGLTVAQSRVAVLLAGGATNTALAAHLGISPHTAKRHTERVLQRLGIDSRTQVGRVLTAGPPPASSAPGSSPCTGPRS